MIDLSHLLQFIQLLSFQDMQEQNKKCHVVVVGAGLSGLTAARQILTKQPGMKVTLLQANDYVGGRTKTAVLNDTVFDLAAQFIGPTQHHAIELALECKNELIPTYDKGTKVVDLQQGYYTYSGTIPFIGNIFSVVELKILITKIERMALKVPLDNPKACPLAYQWDTMTLQNWIDDNAWSTKAKVMFEGGLRVVMGIEPCEISFLYFLYYVRQNQGFQNLITVEKGLQQKKTLKGTQYMSLYLADKIKQKGGQIKLNFVVSKVAQNQNGVSVTNSKGQTIQGDYLIMAMPPPQLPKISFTPPLSQSRKTLCERSFMGHIGKLLLLYPQAYWKDKGFSGEVLSDCVDGPTMNVFDNTHINSEGKQQPALIVFIGGALYRHWKDKQNFQKVLVQKLASYFKEPKMLQPTVVHWNRWQDQSTIGGYVLNYPPGILTQIGDMRKPEGKIHWAGTQMALVSTGYMDGAIESGKRVAKQILQRKAGTARKELEKKEKQLPYTKWNRPPPVSLWNRLFPSF